MSLGLGKGAARQACESTDVAIRAQVIVARPPSSKTASIGASAFGAKAFPAMAATFPQAGTQSPAEVPPKVTLKQNPQWWLLKERTSRANPGLTQRVSEQSELSESQLSLFCSMYPWTGPPLPLRPVRISPEEERTFSAFSSQLGQRADPGIDALRTFSSSTHRKGWNSFNRSLTSTSSRGLAGGHHGW